MTDLGLINRIAAAGDVENDWSLATQRFAAAGFARANYGLTRFRSERSYGDVHDALFLSTAGAQFEQRYFRNDFFARTPLFHWAIANVGICTWRWVQEDYEAGRLTPDEAEAVRENLGIGVIAGLTISFPANSRREKGALGLIADPGLDLDAVDRIFDHEGEALHAVAHAMHLKLAQLPAPRRMTLTPRQREALEWVADGKTTRDIAAIMAISPAMVEKHMRLAREALGVDTTAQAVAKATLLKLMFQSDRPQSRAAMPDRS